MVTPETQVERRCGWCRATLEGRPRARFCGQRCRQAHWRFARQVARLEDADRTMRLAYADPPYPGLARRYYGAHPDYAGEVDHRELLSRLESYDGWALSTSSRALPEVLHDAAALGLDVRVAAWLRGSRGSWSAWPRSAWEPVVYAGGRRVVSRSAVEAAGVEIRLADG